MEITDYHDWGDGLDFRPNNPNFCEKCEYKGTFLKKVKNPETGLISTIASDCNCKIEFIAKLRLKTAGIQPRYCSLDPKIELNEKALLFIDKFYNAYNDPNKLSKNFLITGKNLHEKTKFLSVFAKQLILKSPTLQIKYITMADLLFIINKVWKINDYSEIEEFYKYDFLFIDKIELGLPHLKQNMNMVTFNNIFDRRDLAEKPTIISCESKNDLDFLNLDEERFLIKDLK